MLYEKKWPVIWPLFISEGPFSATPFTENGTLQSPIFRELPKVNIDPFRILLRTLAGLADFARTTSHYTDENVI